MRIQDIDAVARGLKEARPGSYPNGGPDTEDGWRMWNACCYTVQQELARCTRNWSEHRRLFEELSGQNT